MRPEDTLKTSRELSLHIHYLYALVVVAAESVGQMAEFEQRRRQRRYMNNIWSILSERSVVWCAFASMVAGHIEIHILCYGCLARVPCLLIWNTAKRCTHIPTTVSVKRLSYEYRMSSNSNKKISYTHRWVAFLIHTNIDENVSHPYARASLEFISMRNLVCVCVPAWEEWVRKSNISSIFWLPLLLVLLFLLVVVVICLHCSISNVGELCTRYAYVSSNLSLFSVMLRIQISLRLSFMFQIYILYIRRTE